MSATALDLIKGALRRTTSYQSGDAISPQDANDYLETLNDLLDSLSTDHDSIVGSIENILQWIPNQNQYRLGNPLCTDLGLPAFTGTLTADSPIITGITNMPASLVAGGAPPLPFAGSTLSDTANCIPAGTYVIAIGTNTVTMSANASATPSGTDAISYTVPGDFAIARPLRITAGFTRFSQLDFDLAVYATQAQYTSILYKAQPGPWPTAAWYNPQMPYGILNVYQTPGNAAPLHLFTDSILGNLTLNQVFYMPQGYDRWIKWLLAFELCSEFGFSMRPEAKTSLADAQAKIKALNAQPAAVARYDRALTMSQRADAGYIIHGGYGR